MPHNSVSYTVEASEIGKDTKTIDIQIDEKIAHLSELYNIDAYLVERIIWCESQFNINAVYHNKDKNGNVWSKDEGLFQLNNHFHPNWGSTWQDNLEYGFTLLENEGTTPWNASKHCWNKV